MHDVSSVSSYARDELCRLVEVLGCYNLHGFCKRCCVAPLELLARQSVAGWVVFQSSNHPRE
jgi:hypothetical protein